MDSILTGSNLYYREDRMSQLWKPVLTKLSTALRMWNAKDKTAHIMLSPWKRALHPFMLEEFLRGTILPKLSEIMKNWQINPSAQDHSVWSAVLLWHDMFQPETFVVFLLNTVCMSNYADFVGYYFHNLLV